MQTLIERFCAQQGLATYDPYDIWKTSLGFQVKKFYNRRPRLALVPAAAFTLFDGLLNHKLCLFYTPSEYPIVRSMAALCLLNLYRNSPDHMLLETANHHLQWLLKNSCPGHSGYCWGLGFANPISSDLIYSRDAPLSTMTPYALEAFVAFAQVTGETSFHPVIESIFRFFDHDIQVMEEDDEVMSTSYGSFGDRIVINAVSYTMYSYALCLSFAPSRQAARMEAKIRKLYAYIRRRQRGDGSWFYSPQGRSFIDCFHSCIVLKNVIKTGRIIPLNDSRALVVAGYEYLKTSFLDNRKFLFKRFSVRNKPGLIRFDLYDNAEALNLALLLGDNHVAGTLLDSIIRRFCRNLDIYSQIDVIGRLINKNRLRWAVMPFLYAASQMLPTASHSEPRASATGLNFQKNSQPPCAEFSEP